MPRPLTAPLDLCDHCGGFGWVQGYEHGWVQCRHCSGGVKHPQPNPQPERE